MTEFLAKNWVSHGSNSPLVDYNNTCQSTTLKKKTSHGTGSIRNFLFAFLLMDILSIRPFSC